MWVSPKAVIGVNLLKKYEINILPTSGTSKQYIKEYSLTVLYVTEMCSYILEEIMHLSFPWIILSKSYNLKYFLYMYW